MALNRFSAQPVDYEVQSEFIPLPLDLIAKQMERRQENYDATKQFLNVAQESVYGVKGLDVDMGTLKGITSAYDAEIDKALTEVGGDYSRLKGFAEGLGSRIKKDITTGHLANINANYNKAQEALEEAKKKYNSGDLRKSTYDRITNSIANFTGTIQKESGNYSQVDPYTGTKQVNIQEAADKYGANIHYRYTAEGRPYRTVKENQQLVLEGLWNDQQVVQNAKDEIWATYGQVDEVREHTLLKAYLGDIAGNTARKLAFYHPSQKDKGDDPSKPRTIPRTVSIPGYKPELKQINLGDIEFNRVLNAPFNLMEGLPVLDTKEQIKYGAIGLANLPLAIPTMLKDLTKWGVNKFSEWRSIESKEVDIKDMDLIKDVAAIEGIQLGDKTTFGTVRQLQEATTAGNKLSSSFEMAEVDPNVDKLMIDDFKAMALSGALEHYTMYNAATGSAITGAEKQEIVRAGMTGRISDDMSKGTLALKGYTVKQGDTFPENSRVISYVDAGGELHTLVVDLAQNTATPDYLYSRALAAKNAKNGAPGGVSGFVEPGGTTHRFLYAGNGVIRHYINNKYTGKDLHFNTTPKQ